MTILSILQKSCSKIGLPRPSAAIGSTDEGVLQLIELAYGVADNLYDSADWQDLITTRTFTCGASNPQSGEFQTNFKRLSRGVDIWNTTKKWPIHGPVTPEFWQDLTVRTITSLPQYWRQIGGVLNIYAPNSGDSISYEYIKNTWIFLNGSAGSPATVFGADTDTMVFPERLIELGIVWMWKQAKQLDYAEDLATFERAKDAEILDDRGGVSSFSTVRNESRRPYKTWPGTITP